MPPPACPIRDTDRVNGSGSLIPLITKTTATSGASTIGFLNVLRIARPMPAGPPVWLVLFRIMRVIGETTMDPQAMATATDTSWPAPRSAAINGSPADA